MSERTTQPETYGSLREARLNSEDGADRLDIAFEGIDYVLGEHVVVTLEGDSYHREAPTGDAGVPACGGSQSTDWKRVDPGAAIRGGFKPCGNCYKPILEFLASQSDNPVEYTTDKPRDDREVAGVSIPLPSEEDEIEPLPLTSLTEEVIASQSTMHAPAADGPACGMISELARRVKADVVRSHRDPCRLCFDLDDTDV